MHDLEQAVRARLAAVTGGIATDDYVRAYWDWLLKLAGSTRAQTDLLTRSLHTTLDTWHYAALAAAGAAPAPAMNDPRFAAPAWQQWPFNVYARTFSNWAAWAQEAADGVPDLSERNRQLMAFSARQALDAFSPAHYLATNPQLLEVTQAEGGRNLLRGLKHWLEDLQRTVKTRMAIPDARPFRVGHDVAVTPGKVVLRNELMELIQYSPQTPQVYAEPVLITPAWIMKYYILDLSPANSLVRYLVEQGHTVFIVSWKNPTATDRHLGLQDYVRDGFDAALAGVAALLPGRRVHAVGYCIGGTLLAIAAALQAARGDTRLASLTLFAGQTDFSEPGELSLFISPSQLALLDALMHKEGVLSSDRMAGAFALLRASDLLWAPAIRSYVRGERDAPTDLMTWNADGTRMPARMHSEYLRKLYLENALAQGSFEIAGQRVDLRRLQLPMFVVGTETDHVAPWRSVYKARALVHSSDYTFLLTSGGHNAGVISGPVHPKRRHRVLTWTDSTTTLTPDEWLKQAPLQAGSWWPTWQKWLVAHSGAQRVAPPQSTELTDAQKLGDAPGRYVFD